MTDTAADEERVITDAEDPTLATDDGDGTKSLGYKKFPPKPGLPTDADDAGREGDTTTDEYGREIVMKSR